MIRALLLAGALATTTAAPPPAPKATGVGTATARNEDGEGYHLVVLVNGVRVRMLVDTGANVTVLTAADARRARVADDGSDMAIDGMGGTQAMGHARIVSLGVAGLEFGPVDDAAIDDSPDGESILGMDVLDQEGVRIAIEHGTLTIAAR